MRGVNEMIRTPAASRTGAHQAVLHNSDPSKARSKLRKAAGPLGINLKDRNMKSLNKIFWFGLTISIIMSCAVTKDYERAVTTNSVSAYENYNYKM